MTESNLLRWRTSNAMILHDLDACDRGWSPSFYQRGLVGPGLFSPTSMDRPAQVAHDVLH